MKRFAIVALPASLFAACGEEDHDLYGEDEGHDHHHHDHGPAHEVGSLEIAGESYRVEIAGDVEPGAEVHVTLSGGNLDAAPGIRAWFGDEGGIGSDKAQLEAHGDHLDSHVIAPDPMPENAKLWLAVEAGEGDTETHSFDLP